MKLGAKKKQRIRHTVSQLSPLARAFCGYSEKQPYLAISKVPKLKKKKGPPPVKLDFDQLQELYYNNSTFEDMAAHFKITTSAIWHKVNRLIKAGKLTKRGRLNKHNSYLPEDSLIKLFNQGLSYKEIATNHGVSPTTVYNNVKKLVKSGVLKPRYNKKGFTVGK